MFSTYDLGSFNQIESVNILKSAATKPKQKTTRSKTGCLACRQQKKKCDETHPTCLYCQRKGIKCEKSYKHYSAHKSKITKSRTQKQSNAAFLTEVVNAPEGSTGGDLDVTGLQNGQEFSNAIVRHNDNFTPSRNEIIFNIGSPPTYPKINTPKFSMFDDFQYNDYNDIFNIPILLSPSSNFNLYLDEIGMKYLNYFENKVAHLLSISPQSSNYFLKTFFTIAITDECLLNALAAWGALFHADGDIEQINRYLNKAKLLLKPPQLKYDYMLTLAYYLIALGIQICSGDVKNWFYYFNKSGELLQQYGGIIKFLKDFNFSNDSKFLIANFQIHDIMSSSALSSGTICSMNSYNDLFKTNKILELDGYGIDPYQGCIQPIFLIMGEIMNIYADLKSNWKRINEAMQSMNDVSNQRLVMFKRVDDVYKELLDKINSCKPIDSQLQLLTPLEIDLHLKLFELHKLTCKIYILLYIKQTQPISSEIQYLLLQSTTLLEELSESSVISSLNMPLLINGICACYKFDRLKLDNIITQVYTRYKVGNVRKIWDVIKESWRRNPHGNQCIDWIDICNDFGWKLSVC